MSPFTFALYFLVASLTNLAQRTVRSSLVPIPFPLISDSLGHTDRETENTDRETPQADHSLFVWPKSSHSRSQTFDPFSQRWVPDATINYNTDLNRNVQAKFKWNVDLVICHVRPSPSRAVFSVIMIICHSRVAPSFRFQSEAKCEDFWYKNDFFHSHANKTNFHEKDLALASFSAWEFLELGNGLLRDCLGYHY